MDDAQHSLQRKLEQERRHLACLCAGFALPHGHGDEADNARQQVSWISPVARALLKARVGDEVQLPTPGGLRALEIVAVRYPPKGERPGPDAY